jgi:D-serine deaminase-like pyridoxal phosphate-dependent protein
MIQTLPTPAILIDGEKVRANLARLAGYCKEHDLNLRPHTKTHKSSFFARLQLEYGATGLTIAKVGEAQVMATVCNDLFMAYPAVDPLRGRELAQLAHTHTIRVGIDSKEAADNLSHFAQASSSTIGILVDLDVGLHRTGTQFPADALALAQHVSSLPHLRLDGLMFYPGHIPSPSSPTQGAAISAVKELLSQTLDLFDKHSLPHPILSGGSTPTMYQSHLFQPFITEIRPGTYIFNDMNTVYAGLCTIHDCAARIISTVISTAVANQFVLDAGTKTLTSDRCGPAPDSGHGHILEYPLAKIVKLTEEHAQVDCSLSPTRPSPGDRVTLIPNHICPCVNLQDYVYYQSNPDSPPGPLHVEGRGKVF